MTNPAIITAYRYLACAIVAQAFRDAQSCYPARAAIAKQWLVYSPLAAELMAELDIDRDAVIDIVRKIGYNDNRVVEIMREAPGEGGG